MAERFRPDINKEPAGILITVENLVDVEPGVQAAAEHAIATVWEAHTKEPTVIKLRFCSGINLELDDGRTVSVASLYEPRENTISIAIGTIRESHGDSGERVMARVYAAHEARHAVQQAIGDPAPATSTTWANGTYVDSRHEVEAWESSVAAFTAIGVWIEFTVGERNYSNRR